VNLDYIFVVKYVTDYIIKI
jgi:hypothetical protein